MRRFTFRNVYSFTILLLALFHTGCKPGATLSGDSDSTSTDIDVNIPEKVDLWKDCSELPCWEGIYIGTTSYSEAKAVLDSIYQTENVSFDNGNILWESDETGGAVAFQDDIATYILISLGLDQLSVEELITQIGEPDRVTLWIGTTPGLPCNITYLVFREAGLLASVYPINSEKELVGVFPGQYIYRLDFTSDISRKEDLLYHTNMEWAGYTDYCTVYKKNSHYILYNILSSIR